MTTAAEVVTISSKLRSTMRRSFSSCKIDWQSAFDEIRVAKQATVKHMMAAIQVSQDTFSNRVLAKAGLMSIEADFNLAYIGGIDCFNDAALMVVQWMDRTHEENREFNAFEIHREILRSFLVKHSKFLALYDQGDRLKGVFQRAIMEAISFCEDFKSYWMDFFSSDQYYDLVDIGEQHMEDFNRMVFGKAEESLRGYQVLNSILRCEMFERSLIDYRKFSLRIGKLIFDYYCEIGVATQNRLKRMNDCIKDSKFMTTHIVVAAVARLRYILKEENLRKFNQLSYLKFVDSGVLQGFWKQAVLNFDKDFRKPKDVKDRLFADSVQGLCMVERESDGKRGVLVYLKNTFDRYMIYKGKDNRLHMNNVQNVSNR